MPWGGGALTANMRSGSAAKLIVDALLQRFLPLARRRIDTAQAQDGQYLRASDPAYEQVLDSLGVVAHHTPVPLLEALLKWRESESPKGANDVSTFQRKLAVECIFCSACIRFVESCPPEVLTERYWMGLEDFVFDWLINADRIVSQVDYPSLVDLRGLLLDLVAQLLGALSRIRFSSVSERFFTGLNARTRMDNGVSRAETINIIHGMRYFKLGVDTLGGLNASTDFIAKANPLNRAPAKKKRELHHALCSMLSSVLAPLADGRKGLWPPSGVDHALTLWYEAVSRIRLQVVHWMDKQSKHIIVGYPLVTLLLCLGEPQIFSSNLGGHLDMLYKLLKEKHCRSMALECLHRVLRFYLNVYADSQQKNRVWVYLHGISTQLLANLRKGSLTLDLQHDKLVDFCVTVAESNLDFCMNHMILELLQADNPSEAKVIGIRALLAVVSLRSLLQFATDSYGAEDSHGSATTLWGTSAPSPASASPRHPDEAAVGLIDVPTHDITRYIPKVRAALGSILRACNSTFGTSLLTTSKTATEPMPKEKTQGWILFQWALKCAPHLVPEQWRNDDMPDKIPMYAVSIEPGVREEAVQVLYRTVRDYPQLRFAVMRGMANFILRIPDDYPLLINTSLGRLVQLLRAWRSCLHDEKHVEPQLVDESTKPRVGSHSSTPSRSEQSYAFDPSGMDAVGLIFLCSVDSQIRYTALDLLRSVRELQNDITRLSTKDQEFGKLQMEVGTPFVIDVFEETGDDIVQSCYWDFGRCYDMRREWDSVPAEATLQSVLEGPDRSRWARCLSGFVTYVAGLCRPDAIYGARLEVVNRLSYITPSDFGGKAGKSHDIDSKLDQWHMYSMFACSCPPENTSDAGAGSVKELLRLIFPFLRAGSESQAYAATLALGHSHLGVSEVMLNELSLVLDEVTSELESRPKWKSQKVRRRDIRVHVADIYRMVAEHVWPGTFSRKPMLRLHFVKFIEDTVRHISSSTPESFQEVQPLRYSLACVLRSLSAELVKSNSERFDPRARKKLFDLLSSWSDDTTSAWSQDSVSDYRREIERYKASLSTRSKDSNEKITLEKEINERVEVIQWVAMNAMAALLYGPCFDDSVRKMSGRIVSWINGLFLEPAQRIPVGYSPADPRTVSPHSKHGLPDVRYGGNRDRHRGSASRVSLAKTALMNLLRSNLDLFPACIDQCYSSDPSIADGYFSVLAEVYMRHEVPKCEIQRLLSLILYKVVDQSRQIRDDALQMLETLSIREWAEEGEGAGRYNATVVGSLPDSYQQFQYQLSAKLAKEHPELSEWLCEEIMQRQLDSVDVIAQHQVLTCMAPWIENLNFVTLWESGWSERLLKSLYYVTWRRGDQFPDEIEKLWSTIAKKWRNIIPVLDFLISKGMEDCDSNASAEISGAFATYFSVAKRISLYLARNSPQQTIDHLVYELAQRMLEDHPEQLKRQANAGFELDANVPLQFSQGPVPPQAAQELPMHMSPLLVRSTHDGPIRNVSGNLSWRTGTGRSMSGPLNNMPELYQAQLHQGRSGQLFTELHQGRSGQLFTGSGPLMNIAGVSGSMHGVRSATGSLKSRHLSRDSGDYFGDVPVPGDDMRSSTPVLNPGELQKALQPHHHWLSRADIALILLAEIAYENDEDFRGHLPLLFHVTFVSMDSSEDIVLEHCQQLLVNLLYSLAGRHLELYDVGEHGDGGEYKQQVVSLIKYVQSKKSSMMWENEDMRLTRTDLPSSSLLSALVLSVVDAIFFQGDLRERWGEEALKWAMESSNRHLACRSHQIYRALRPTVTSDTCVSLLRCLHRCLCNPTPPVLGFVMEILLTLQVMVGIMEPEKVILYPQLFWGCVAMLHTDFVHVYTQVLELIARVLDRLPFNDQTTDNVLLSNMPRDEFEDNQARDFENLNFKGTDMSKQFGEAGLEAEKAPVFEGVQPLVLKGLLSSVSHASAIDVLSRITLHSCDRIFGDSDTRLLMHIVGLLPWLCLQLLQKQTPRIPGSDSPLEQQYQKALAVSANISQSCGAKHLDELAAVFASYAAGYIASMEALLDFVAPLLCAEWFPGHSGLAFGHLLRLLEKGPVEYQRIILLMLRVLLQHTPVDAAQSPQVYAAVSQLVESPLCWEALNVLEAVLQSASTLGSFQVDLGEGNNGENSSGTPHGTIKRADDDRPAASLVSQSSFKARSGQLQLWVASGGPPPMPGASRSSLEVLPSREAALQNTKLALGRVLDTYGAGKKRDYKRLVPFVASSVRPQTSTTPQQHAR